MKPLENCTNLKPPTAIKQNNKTFDWWYQKVLHWTSHKNIQLWHYPRLQFFVPGKIAARLVAMRSHGDIATRFERSGVHSETKGQLFGQLKASNFDFISSKSSKSNLLHVPFSLKTCHHGTHWNQEPLCRSKVGLRRWNQLAAHTFNSLAGHHWQGCASRAGIGRKRNGLGTKAWNTSPNDKMTIIVNPVRSHFDL